MISPNEKKLARGLLQTPQWRIAELIADEMCDKLKTDSVVRESEWETLKTALLNEGQIRGIRNFLQEIYNYAQND